MGFAGYQSIIIDEARTGGKFFYMGDPMNPGTLGYIYMTPEQWAEFKSKILEME